MENLPKDVLYLIAMELEDVLSFSLTNKRIYDKVCNNIYFIRNKLRKDFGFYYSDTDTKIANIYYNYLCKERSVYKTGYDWSWAMGNAAIRGYKDLTEYCVFKGANDWNWGLRWTVNGNSKNTIDLTNYFISKGADNLNKSMYFAARRGRQDLVECLISNGANMWDLGLEGSARGGHKDLIKYFEDKGANFWARGMEGAARGGHKDLVDYFYYKGDTYWQGALQKAREGGHEELAKYIKNNFGNTDT